LHLQVLINENSLPQKSEVFGGITFFWEALEFVDSYLKCLEYLLEYSVLMFHKISN